MDENFRAFIDRQRMADWADMRKKARIRRFRRRMGIVVAVLAYAALLYF